MNHDSSSYALESYARTADFADRAAHLVLAPALWEIFARLDTPASVATIARQLQLEPALVHAGLQELARHALVSQHVLSWRDFQKATPPPARPADPDSHPSGAAAAAPAPLDLPSTVTAPLLPPPAAAVPEPACPEATATPATVPPATVPARAVPRATGPATITIAARSEPLVFHLENERARQIRRQAGAAIIQFHLGHAAAPASPSPVLMTGWKLRPLLQSIIARGGGGTPGHLLVYRVFLQVPSELMVRAGLHTLSLADETYTIRDPDLYRAIAISMRDVAGIALPEFELADPAAA